MNELYKEVQGNALNGKKKHGAAAAKLPETGKYTAGYSRARSQFCWYLRGVPHANVYKQEVVHVETLNDLRRITHAIQRDLRD